MRRSGRSLVRRWFSSFALCAIVALSVAPVLGQSAPGSQEPPAPLAFKVLVDQVAAQFPVVKTEVVEASGQRVTLAAGRSEGVQPGVEMVMFREGRELYHPTTKKLLGRTEETVGRIVVTEVFESYSIATQRDGTTPQPGDKARVSSGKVPLTLVTLGGGVRSRLIEAAVQDLIQEFDRTGRFQISLGDQIGMWLAEQKIGVDDFLGGKGVAEVGQRFKVAHVLALNFTTQQSKPFVDARLFSTAIAKPLVQSAFVVPPEVRVKPTEQYSSGGGVGQVKVEKRSLLAKLLSGNFEPNQYSASAASIPIRQLAVFPFVVHSMDVAVQPSDKTARLVVTDGQRVFQYRLNGNGVLEAEWTYSKMMVGKILNVQFADINNDGVLDVVVNRQDVKVGMLGYILTTRDGKPAVLADDIDVILLAVDEHGDGVKRTLWGQRYDSDNFFGKGATRYVLKKKDIAAAGKVQVPDDFRMAGAVFSSINGKSGRALAYVDAYSRLKITAYGQDLWRSATPVGGGLAHALLQKNMLRTQVDKNVKIEPNPVSVDLDGDGVEEVIVPVNEDELGRMAVVFKGPAGFRMQVVTSGFEGMISGLGAFAVDGAPSLVAAVTKREGLLRTGGDTQILMTVPE